MKIENIIKSQAATRGKATKSATTPLLQPENQPISDDVQLTANAEKMSQLEGELKSVDVSDSGKIESIRQQITEGRFKVDEEVVAENLIQETIANISRRAGQRMDN